MCIRDSQFPARNIQTTFLLPYPAGYAFVLDTLMKFCDPGILEVGGVSMPVISRWAVPSIQRNRPGQTAILIHYITCCSFQTPSAFANIIVNFVLTSGVQILMEDCPLVVALSLIHI